MPITLGQNRLSLRAGRVLSSSTDALSLSYERLSSGQRINRASDDAAGLAIATSLNADARVLSQGVRNINDGVSLLNIADGALQELRAITVRQKELAEQAANGTYSQAQRKALNSEASALTSEYNRILATTKFNGISLLDSSPGEVRIQGGRGLDNSIAISLGSAIAGSTGDGTFQARTTFSAGTYPAGLVAGDFNGDGNADLITADSHPGSNSISVLLGLGDGTFKARLSYAAGSGPVSVTSGDINGDGVLDIVATENGANSVSVLIGNGNGSFRERVSFITGTSPQDSKLGDFNGDNVLDLVVSANDGTFSLLLGNGDGSFKTKTSFATSGTTEGIVITDFNSDGKLDVLASDNTSGLVRVFQGDGAGSFTALSSLTAGWGPHGLTTFDGNRDGHSDIAVTNSNGDVVVFMGQGNGQFLPQGSYTTGANPGEVYAGDFDGDGIVDLATSDAFSSTMSILIGNGDGSFRSKTSYTAGAWTAGITAADFNKDGVLDIATADLNAFGGSIFLGNSRQTSHVSHLDIGSPEAARLSLMEIDKRFDRIVGEIGRVGVFQSRLSAAVNSLQVMKENMVTASSRITDADVASETATLVARQIVQKSASAILAQANSQPALALTLLS